EARLTDVAGASAAVVVDLLTYSARGRFVGPAHSLSLRGAATHLIPPGGYGYDLLQRRPLVAGRPEPAPAAAGRTFAALRLPAGCGPLWLAGGLAGDPAGAVTQRFAALSGGPAARLVVLALGYAQTAEAQADAQAFAAALHSQAAAVAWFVLEAKLDQAALQGALGPATGVLITAPDQSRVLDALAGAPAVVSALRARWQQGLALLADNAAAAALGEAVSLNAPSTAASLEADAVRSFRADGVPIRPGLAFVPGVAVEPRLLPDRHWGQLYNHVHRRPARLAVGVDVNTALELSASGATVVGESAVVTLDGRCAGFSLGSNGALGARWVLLDTFAAGEPVHP
ncbi:MAG: hypothetical protein JNK29_20020, partial [Anaerolineales bacterium]|nr:hypothetical protein [Anaerolineales bacterium]